MAKNDRTTTIEHRKNNTTYNKRTKAAKPNPNLKLEKKEKTQKKKQNQSCSFFFFSVLVRCFSAFVSLCFFVFVCFFSLLFSLFSTSCLHVRRSRSSSHLRKEKHDKTSGKNSGKKNSERRPKKTKKRKETNRI
jgi:Flp pilus assembly protein TadB